MSEVSCRSCVPIIEAVDRRGLSGSELVVGLSFSVEDLRRPANRIGWDEFAIFLSRAARLLGGADQLETIAVDYMYSARSSGLLRAISSRFINAQQVYVVASKWYGPSLYSNTHASLEYLPDGRIRETIEIDLPYRESPEFFRMMLGSVRAMPAVLGQRDAFVEFEGNGRRGVYTITPPPGLTVWQRMRRALRERRVSSEEVGELMVHHREVQESYDRLARETRERERIEHHLQQASKIEAIGQLAGGLAHDFNNVLTVIDGFAGLASEKLGEEHPAWSDLEEIRAESERASGLIKQLLAFSRRQTLLLRRMDINALLRSITNMMRLLVGESIELVIVQGDDLGLVMADPGQLEQIIINLIMNSRDATLAGGRITVETSNASLSSPSGESTEVVKLEVRDNGSGMNSETKMRIFEPFFTSKERGKGTGLGLATVYGIVTQSGGTIDVQSELGKGTAISLWLPRVDGEPDALDGADSEEESDGGCETLLLVEDDDHVRAVSRRILEQKGYTVLEADSGERALRVCGSHAGPIGLVVTDIVMPGMDGRELSERLPRVRPELRGVVFVSGYAEQRIDTEGSESLERAFLRKPFTGPALLSTVRRLLDSGR